GLPGVRIRPRKENDESKTVFYFPEAGRVQRLVSDDRNFRYELYLVLAFERDGYQRSEAPAVVDHQSCLWPIGHRGRVPGEFDRSTQRLVKAIREETRIPGSRALVRVPGILDVPVQAQARLRHERIQVEPQKIGELLFKDLVPGVD